MSEEAAGHHGSVTLAGLQLWQEVVTVEVVQLLQVAEDDAPLPSQVLGDVSSVQQGEVVGEDVGQRADVLPLGEQKLLQDSLQPPVQTDRRRNLIPLEFQLKILVGSTSDIQANNKLAHQTQYLTCFIGSLETERGAHGSKVKRS